MPVDPHAAELTTSLRTSASEFARRALKEFLNEEWGPFLLHAATSLEHLTKSYLASIDPALIADGRSFDSLLHAVGKGRHARTPRARMVTINMDESLKRCGQLLPPVANLREDLQLLLLARNGVVHLGEVDEAAASVITPYLQAMRQLLGELGVEFDDFWGDFEELVATRVAESSTAAAVAVQEALTGARTRFADRYGHLTEEVLHGLRESVAKGYNAATNEEQLLDCPACDSQALVVGSLTVDWEPDWDYSDGEPWVSGVYPVATFFPGTLHCGVCGLDLDGEDEMKAAGLESSWLLEEVDPSEFFEELEEW